MVKKNRLHESGQALLIILLVMTVGLTIGLSAVSRSSTDIKISTQMEDSSRAFAAAEAGIEAALKGEASGNGTFGNTTYNFTSANAGNSTQFFISKVSIGDTYTIWLVEHNQNTGEIDATNWYGKAPNTATSIDICWTQTSGTTEPSMEITLVYLNSSGTYQVYRGAYNNNSLLSNNFILSSSLNCGDATNFSKGVTFSFPANLSKPYALRLRPFYAEAKIELQRGGTGLIPSQGLNITSTGTSGESTRKVTVTRTYPVLPAIFDYVLFSGGSLTK